MRLSNRYIRIAGLQVYLQIKMQFFSANRDLHAGLVAVCGDIRRIDTGASIRPSYLSIRPSYLLSSSRTALGELPTRALMDASCFSETPRTRVQ
jgi:hypothetical protein